MSSKRDISRAAGIRGGALRTSPPPPAPPKPSLAAASAAAVPYSIPDAEKSSSPRVDFVVVPEEVTRTRRRRRRVQRTKKRLHRPYAIPDTDGSASPRVDFATGSPRTTARRSRTPSPSASAYGDTATGRSACFAALTARLDESLVRERHALWLRWNFEQLALPAVEPTARKALDAAYALEKRRRKARTDATHTATS